MWSEEDSNWIFNLLFYITIKFVYYQNTVKKYRKFVKIKAIWGVFWDRLGCI